MKALSHIFRLLMIPALLCTGCIQVYAQDQDVTVSDDTETRINPEMNDAGADFISSRSKVDFKRYPFLKLDENRIHMNHADWSGLAERFDSASAGKATVTVVMIGDSHVQPDGNSGRLRMNLQDRYGNAGRGLMIPYRVVGTNNPLDYRISTSTPVSTAKLMKLPWTTTMGFTGIAVHPEVSSSVFTLRSEQPFSGLNIYASGSFTVTALSSAGSKIHFDSQVYDWGVSLSMSHPQTEVSVTLNGSDYTVFGFDARNGKHGVLVHSIGNNGATFSTYSMVGGMGKHLSALSPDLVIISLGTNEAFGKVSNATFSAQMDHLISDIRNNNPKAEILLVTPMECQRSVYSRSRKRRRRRTRTYQVNANVVRMRDNILRYGKENDIPVYDFYQVAGGRGASIRWIQNKLMSGDRIHRTWNGYYLEGELLSDALLRALSVSGLRTGIYAPLKHNVSVPAHVENTGSSGNSKHKHH